MSSRRSSPLPRPVADSLVGRTLATDVLHRLRSDIVNGELSPASRLRFEALRRDYGASFGTLREALAQLVTGGLVIAEGQRGFRVAPISRGDLADLVEAKILIELRIVELAARHGDASWASRVESALAALEVARLVARGRHHLDAQWLQAHRQFHTVVAEGCPSPTLVALRLLLIERWRRYRRVMLRHGLPRRWDEDTHAALAAALLARDGGQACEIMERQLRGGLATLLAEGGDLLAAE